VLFALIDLERSLHQPDSIQSQCLKDTAYIAYKKTIARIATNHLTTVIVNFLLLFANIRNNYRTVLIP